MSVLGSGPEFEVKDSGRRASLGGGMVRDTEEGKVDFTLVLDGPMFERWAQHLTAGARKYAKRNWMRIANADRDAQEAALERFERSALRHLVQYLAGERDEDHAAAVMFNLNGAEFVRDLLAAPAPVLDLESGPPFDHPCATHSASGHGPHVHDAADRSRKLPCP